MRDGENAKLLALYHAGMLCLKISCWHARMREGRKAGRRECAKARLLAVHHAGMLCQEACVNGVCHFSSLGAGSNLVWKAIADLEEY